MCGTRPWRSRRRVSTASAVEKIKEALASFTGIARRQEVRGEARGVKVIDDFGHHPTAIAQTLTALRHRYPGQRIWAIFEPRSNTTRRAVFQEELPDALKLADGVFISQVARLDQIPESDRLNPEAVIAALAESGPSRFLRAGRGAHCRPAGALNPAERHRRGLQQRRVRWHSRENSGAPARALGESHNAKAGMRRRIGQSAGAQTA